MQGASPKTPLVSIAGLDRVEVLRAAWLRSMRNMSIAAIPCVLNMHFDEAAAKVATETGMIRIFMYRLIGLDLRRDDVDASAYDEMYGAGAFAEVARSLRAHQ